MITVLFSLQLRLNCLSSDGTCKYTADYEADFDVLGTGIVRTYSSHECNVAEQILPAAAKKGVKVVLGVWYVRMQARCSAGGCSLRADEINRPDVDEAYEEDKNALKKAIPGNAEAVYAITVGSEALYRGNLTGPELLTKINDIKATFPDVKVGTADSWNKYADGAADALITGGVKFL